MQLDETRGNWTGSMQLWIIGRFSRNCERVRTDTTGDMCLY